MTTRRRLFIGALVGALVTVIAVPAWLLRDPEPVFRARTGLLIDVDTVSQTSGEITDEYEVNLRSSSGLGVSIAIRRPAADRPEVARPESDTGRRQLFVVLGGHQRGKGAGALIGDTRGAVFASLEYPFDGDHSAKGLAVLAQMPAIRRAFYDTPPAVSLALDYLLTLADTDPTRVELVGASFGAPFATIAAARDTRVTRLWVAHGGGRPFLMIDEGLKREIPAGVLRAPVSALATLIASGPRFAPEKWIGRVAPRPVVLLNAIDDERIPQASVDALWSAAGEPREQVWLPGKHMQGDRPDVLRMLVDSVMARAARPD